jgi:hypothetical protein
MLIILRLGAQIRLRGVLHRLLAHQQLHRWHPHQPCPVHAHQHLLSARGSAADEAANGGKGKGSLRYSKVEVRAKMPKGDWVGVLRLCVFFLFLLIDNTRVQLWPAIWLLPVNSTYGSWPRSGEIDMVESRGNGIRYTNR